jgi:DNA-binding transcriptional regulator YiaG
VSIHIQVIQKARVFSRDDLDLTEVRVRSWESSRRRPAGLLDSG